MKTISFIELKRLLYSGEYNFLSAGITPLHLISQKVFIKYLTEKGALKKGIVIQSPHRLTGYCGLWDELSKCYKNIEVYRLEENKCDNIIRKILALSYDFIYLFRLWIHRLNGKCDENKFYYGAIAFVKFERRMELVPINYRINYLIGEEGLSSYIGFPPINHQSKINSLKDKIFQYASKDIRRINLFMFEKDGCSHLSPNPLSFNFYKEVFNEMFVPQDLVKSLEGSVIVCTNCFDAHTYQVVNDLEVLSEMDVYCKNKHINLIIKPHPREKIDRYKSIDLQVVDDNQYPMEAIIANMRNKPICILSYYSTLLVECIYMWKIPAYSLLGLFDINAWAGQDKFYSTSFLNTFGKNVPIIRDFKDLPF